jgi:hypothetical protein
LKALSTHTEVITREQSPLDLLLSRDVNRKPQDDDRQRIEQLVAKSCFVKWAWPLHFCREVRHELFVNEPMVMDWTVYRECVIVGNCREVFASRYGYSFGTVKDCVVHHE